MIIAVCIVGANNNPLYLEVANMDLEHDEILKIHQVCHCALDYVDEALVASRLAAQKSSGGAPESSDTSYLGLLYPTDEYKIYGHVTNTDVKILLVLDDALVRDEELKSALEGVHRAYVDAISNPFYTPGQPITSPRFEKRLKNMLRL